MPRSEPERFAVAARAAAARVVARVAIERRFLDSALAQVHHDHPGRPAEWALIQELSYGTLRWYHELVGVAALFLSRPLKSKDADVHALLLVGLYQLRHMRVADYAAVDATVAAAEVLNKPWAKGLVNACLRAALRETGRIDAARAASEVMRFSHPAWLIDAVRHDHPDGWQRILDANNERPPMTLRVNVARTARADYLARLAEDGLDARAHPASDSALVLHRPVPVERLPGFDRGMVSVQDAAAQLAAVLLDTQPHERVLDACAAPGGKAAHILERARGQAALTALDVDPDRLARVGENLARLGLTARLVTADAARPEQWWDGQPFDRILLDAPCSATGVIRRHPDVKVRRRADDMAKLLPAQARLLDGVWPCLAPGGKLVYVTCSVLAEENERQVSRFLARQPDAAVRRGELGGAGFGRQILPGENEMDGFYYACVHKV